MKNAAKVHDNTKTCFHSGEVVTKKESKAPRLALWSIHLRERRGANDFGANDLLAPAALASALSFNQTKKALTRVLIHFSFTIHRRK